MRQTTRRRPPSGSGRSSRPRRAVTRPARSASDEVPGARAGRAVRVAVDAIADRPDRTFSYRLPDDLGDPAPGSLLLVPYGHRLALGYLLSGEPESGADVSPEAPIKSVEAVVSGPMLTPDLLGLAEEIAVSYRAPIGTTLAAMLPPGLESRLERRWRIADASRLPAGMPDAVDAEGLLDEVDLRAFA